MRRVRSTSHSAPRTSSAVNSPVKPSPKLAVEPDRSTGSGSDAPRHKPLNPAAPAKGTDAPTNGRGKVAVACFITPPQKSNTKSHTKSTRKKTYKNTYKKTGASDAALLVAPVARSPESRLEEAVALGSALGLHPSHRLLLAPAPAQAATLLSGGHCERIKQALTHQAVELLFIDATLSPSQQRNLENRLQVKVLDRTGVILEIFARRARSAEGRLQVEQAQLTWQGSRLVRSWTHLERQRGGARKAAGPGERQLELDRRMLEQRLKRTRQRLQAVRRRRGEQRKARSQATATVALVGYTNAGKSTLFDALTRTGATNGTAANAATTGGANRLFATLDPLMRKMDLPFPRPVVLSDTVGFVSDLPHGLVEAFHATLEEVRRADVILHVQDAASPVAWAQAQDVEQVLAELLPAENPPPVIHLRNKADRLAPQTRRQIQHQGSTTNGATSPTINPEINPETNPATNPETNLKTNSATSTATTRESGGLLISAQEGTGLEALRQILAQTLALRFGVRRVEVFLPHAVPEPFSQSASEQAELRAWLYRNAQVEAQASDTQGERLTVSLDRAAGQKLQSRATDAPWLTLRWQQGWQQGQADPNHDTALEPQADPVLNSVLTSA